MKWTCVIRTLCAVMSVTAAVWAKDETSLSSECVPKSVQDAVLECPAGARKTATGRRAPPKMTSVVDKKTPSGVQKPPPPPPIDPTERDKRNAARKLRSLGLLLSETRGLEKLVQGTPKKSADRLQLLRRLAENYAEIEAVSFARQTKNETRAKTLKKSSKDYVEARREAARAKQVLVSARKNAIRVYSSIKDQYPNYSKLDEVLYYLAYEHEQGGDLQSARKVYYELIQKTPKSAYVPHAYFAFGELFFVEAQGEPAKWPLAESAYVEVIKYPPPQNKLHGFARYKLAYVHWNRDQLPEAMSEFKRVIEYSAKYPSQPEAAGLARSARRDLVSVYATAGVAERAWTFFEPLSAGNTIGVLGELGTAYLDKGRYAEAITLYRELIRRDPGARECVYQTQISVATQAQKSGDKPAIVKELERQLAMRDAFAKRGMPADAVRECGNRTAELVSETAMAWHLEAVGSGSVRGTNDKKTMERSVLLYERVTQSFSAEEFSKFTFPRIVREDWPTVIKLRYALGDLYYALGRWEDCARTFDQVFTSNPKGADAAESAYTSLLCYQKLRDELRKGKSDHETRGLLLTDSSGAGSFAPKPIDDLSKRMLAAFDRYLCWVDPKSDKALWNQHVEVEFARARTYYEAQHWEQAGVAFRHVALEHADHDAGIYAAHLYLECMNVLATRATPARAACIDEMGKDVPKLAVKYCSGGRSDVAADQCELLTRVELDLERRRAGLLVKRADALPSGSPEAIELYKKGGDLYYGLWKNRCEEPLGRGEKPKQCGSADELLYDTARAYQAARLLARAMQVRGFLLDPRYGLHRGEPARKATYELGSNYQAIAVYDRAAEFYERYVAESCDSNRKGRCDDKAERALFDSTVLRVGLGQLEVALKNADRYKRWFGAKHPAEAARLAFAVAADYGEKQKWDEVKRRLGPVLKIIDQQATLDVKIQAHALLARAHASTKSNGTARAEYEKVVGLWANPERAADEITSTESDAALKQKKLGRALEAVGEALFYFAERKKESVDAVVFPAYRGPGTKAAVLAHIDTKVKDWIAKKRPLIEDATAAYRKVVDLKPAAPPRFAIAAGARVGNLWGTFVKEFRAAPIPDSIRKDSQLRNAYYEAIDRASEPQKLVAKDAYERCLGYSVRYQHWDTNSRTCEEWLAENFRADYHLVDEFRGAPTRRNDPLAERAKPIPIGVARRRSR